MKAVRALLVTLALALPGAASLVAPPVAAQVPPSSFNAESDAPVAAPVGGGGEVAASKAELASCKSALALEKKDATGMDFLVAAYLALWGILLVFFFMVQVRQSRLRTEMEDLRSRLARLGGGA
jgi:hypothetical protein